MSKLNHKNGGLFALGAAGAMALGGSLRGRGSQARTPKIQVKLGPGVSYHKEDGTSFPLLARRKGRGPWTEVGEVESEMVNLGGFLHEQWVVGSYTATLWERDEEFTVSIRDRRGRIIKSSSDAKREIKSWAEDQIKTLNETRE